MAISGSKLPSSKGIFRSFSADNMHEPSWSNPMQMTGQVECKWMGKSAQLLTRKAWMAESDQRMLMSMDVPLPHSTQTNKRDGGTIGNMAVPMHQW